MGHTKGKGNDQGLSMSHSILMNELENTPNLLYDIQFTDNVPNCIFYLIYRVGEHRNRV